MVCFPPDPVFHALPANSGVYGGELICPIPRSTSSKYSRERAPVKYDDLGALGGGQTGQFCPKTKSKKPRFLARAASKYLQSAQIGRHFQGIFLLRTGNPQFSLASSALVSSQY